MAFERIVGSRNRLPCVSGGKHFLVHFPHHGSRDLADLNVLHEAEDEVGLAAVLRMRGLLDDARLQHAIDLVTHEL